MSKESISKIYLIIEWIIRFGLPKFKEQCQKIIDRYKILN